MPEPVRLTRASFTAQIASPGPPDPNPPLPSQGYRAIYPYPRLNRFDAQVGAHGAAPSGDVNMDAGRAPEEGASLAPLQQGLRLENEAVRLLIAPEYGGRLWQGWNRANGLALFHTPERVGMLNFGLRGAWYTGGVEFNFPNSHSVTTASPVPALLRRLPGGGGTVIVGALDLVSRMTWSVGVRLEPGSANIHFDILLFNRADLPARYWWWINAAVPAGPGLEYTNATTEMLPHFIGRREALGEALSWPLHEGHDLRWYAQCVEPTSLFHLAGDERWFGFYQHDQQQGLVRVGCSADAPGLKFWNSGQSEEGYLWGAGMTGGERYANTELQSGRPETQTDYGVLPPHFALRWSEIWRPVWDLGG